MPNARTLPKSQQQFDFQLPRDKQERKQRMRDLRHHWFKLIEALEDADCGLSKGQRRRVAALMKRWLKSDYSNWCGVGTTRRTYLAKEWMMSRRTVEYQLEWAQSVGVLDWSVDTDERGVRRTTIQLLFVRLAELVGMPSQPDGDVLTECQPEKDDVLAVDQSASVADQSATVADQSATVADQSATIAQHSSNSITPLPPDEWQAVENLFIELGVSDGLAPDWIREARQLELTVADCRDIAETYRVNESKFRGPGAIAFRIRKGEWPAAGVRDPRVIQEAEQKRAAQQRSAREEHAQAIAHQQQWRCELAALEKSYGTEFDALSPAERSRFVRSVLTVQFEFDQWRRNPMDSFVREKLLTAYGLSRERSNQRLAISGQPERNQLCHVT